MTFFISGASDYQLWIKPL